MSWHRIRQLLPACVIVALLATVFVPRPGDTGLWLHTLFEWLHVPVFGLISLALLALTPKDQPRSYRFAWAFVGALFLGVLTEAIQIPIKRDASLEDVIADGLGAAGFLSLAHFWSQKGYSTILFATGGLALLAWSAVPLISVSLAINHRNTQFPVIFSGDIAAERAFVTGHNVQMETYWNRSLAKPYTRTTFIKQRRPGIEIRGLVADWSNYSTLTIDMEVEGSESLSFTVRVHDKAHRRGDQSHSDRFNRKYTVAPGHHVLNIPLEEIAAAPGQRSMDMTKIEALVIFSSKKNVSRVFRLYEIRLY